MSSQRSVAPTRRILVPRRLCVSPAPYGIGPGTGKFLRFMGFYCRIHGAPWCLHQHCLASCDNTDCKRRWQEEYYLYDATALRAPAGLYEPSMSPTPVPPSPIVNIEDSDSDSEPSTPESPPRPAPRMLLCHECSGEVPDNDDCPDCLKEVKPGPVRHARRLRRAEFLLLIEQADRWYPKK